MNRTDPHAPSNFDPANYTFRGWIYLGTDIEKADALTDTGAVRYIEETEKVGPYDLGKCDHCGSRYSYGAVFAYSGGGYITVGHDCAAGRFNTNDRFEFELAFLRRRVAQTRESMKRSQKLAAFLEDHPKLTEAFEWADEMHDISNQLADAKEELYDYEESPEFAQACREHATFERMTAFHRRTIMDIRSKLIRFGDISEKQINFAIRLADEGEGKRVEAKRTAERVAEMEPLPGGRYEITGTILSVKSYDNDYGTTWKLLLALEGDREGYRIYGTLPAALYDQACQEAADGQFISMTALEGARVAFTAKIDPAKGDNDFATYSRPTKARLLALPETTPAG